VPAGRGHACTFEAIAETMARFTGMLGLSRYAL